MKAYKLGKGLVALSCSPGDGLPEEDLLIPGEFYPSYPGKLLVACSDLHRVLGREQVARLVAHLQAWLATGSLELPAAAGQGGGARTA
jgi:hypothetical protein